MKTFRIFVISLAFFSINLYAQTVYEGFPPAGDITMEQYDTMRATIVDHEEAEIILQHPTVTQISIESEYLVCFLPVESHEAYPGIACRVVSVEEGANIAVKTSGWNANPNNPEFRPWLTLFQRQDRKIKEEIIESTGSTDETTTQVSE